MKKLFAFVVVLFGCFSTINAQETSARLQGIISDNKNATVANVTVTLKHEPTGQVFSTQTNKLGLYNFPDLKPGGPYTIKFTSIGFTEQTFTDVYVNLGNNPDLNIKLSDKSENLTDVTVVSNSKRSSSANLALTQKQLNVLPTLGRSLADFTRLTPQSNNNSFGGTNFRYNNLTIDGAINNDAIGFSNSFGGVSGGGQSGAAGAGTRTNPYGIDAIQEVQVQLTPYDVSLGNFTGGSVNAITKSGTNQFHGSVYAFGRNSALMGKSVDGRNTSISSSFYDYQYGASIGGPIIKNKAFFFINVEQTRRQEPTFYNVGDSGAAIKLSEATSIYNKLQQLGYDAGNYLGEYKLNTNSDKIFARVDYKLNDKNSLMARIIYTKGWGNNLERTSTNFQFGNTDFTQYTDNVNLAAELKTKFSSQLNNKFNVSFIQVNEHRDFPGQLAPFIDIDNGRIWAGTWREASVYKMKQQTVEISNNLTLTKGKHKILIGTHNELYNLTYGFINSWNGRWEYSNGVNSFLTDNPTRIRGAFSLDPTKLTNTRDAIYNQPPNPFTVTLLSAYLQDEISISKKLKITPGVRIDYSFVGNQPGVDAGLNTTTSSSLATPTYSHTAFNQLSNTYLGNAIFSPRVGFNYDVFGNNKLVVRGGTGLFSGRVPFAWMGYGYTLNGNIYGNIDWNNIKTTQPVPLAINPQGLKDTVSKYATQYAVGNKAGTKEIDIVDNNFKLPQVWRSSIAVDYKFGQGYKATVDFMYTQTIYDVQFQQINLFDSAQYFTTGPTQTPVYIDRKGALNGKNNSAYSNIFFLSNTNKGYRYNITGQLSKTTSAFRVGKINATQMWNVAYTYGISKDMSNGIRNSWESNYSVNPAISPNNNVLSYSNFDLRHRIVAMYNINFAWNSINNTSVTFVYSAQSGAPYSLVYQSAPGTGGNNASLPYIPKDRSDINLADYKLANGTTYTADDQWNDLNNFINNDDYLKNRRGQYAERNALRTPWVHQLDVKLLHEFKLSKTNKFKTLQLSVDVFNFLNLLNNDWGHVTFVTNVNNYTVNFLKYAKDASGKAVGAPSTGYTPTYNFIKPTGLNGNYYTVDPINSRWQAQIGIKYNF